MEETILVLEQEAEKGDLKALYALVDWYRGKNPKRYRYYLAKAATYSSEAMVELCKLNGIDMQIKEEEYYLNEFCADYTFSNEKALKARLQEGVAVCPLCYGYDVVEEEGGAYLCNECGHQYRDGIESN